MTAVSPDAVSGILVYRAKQLATHLTVMEEDKFAEKEVFLTVTTKTVQRELVKKVVLVAHRSFFRESVDDFFYQVSALYCQSLAS